MSDETLVYDVDGKTVVVEALPGGWKARCTAAERGMTDLRVPSWLSADEIPRFLTLVFGVASAVVRRVW